MSRFPLSLPLLAPFLLSALSCAPEPRIIELEFIAAWDDVPLDCAAEEHAPRLTDLRFYVSRVELYGDDGRVPLELGENGRWQGGDMALVDLEDGSGSCRNGTLDRNSRVVGRVPAGDYRGLRFEVGVPFALNHADPLTAKAPLDDSTMHWHWRSGYKFLRAGFAGANTGASVHLGSAACEGPLHAIERCRYPNRVVVDLRDWRPGMPVAIDLGRLARRVPEGLAADAAHCESGPASEFCHALFPAFGLDPDSGEPASPQEIFRLASP